MVNSPGIGLARVLGAFYGRWKLADMGGGRGVRI